jgi:hypothetical protein
VDEHPWKLKEHPSWKLSPEQLKTCKGSVVVQVKVVVNPEEEV